LIIFSISVSFFTFHFSTHFHNFPTSHHHSFHTFSTSQLLIFYL